MSNINKQALREAAEKATQGPWAETCGEVTTADYEIEGVTFLDHICNCEIIGTESPNAEFISAANPATVLALLDELEAAEKRVAELEAWEVKLPLFDGYVPHIAAELQAAFRIACADAGIITKVGE